MRNKSINNTKGISFNSITKISKIDLKYIKRIFERKALQVYLYTDDFNYTYQLDEAMSNQKYQKIAQIFLSLCLIQNEIAG